MGFGWKIINLGDFLDHIWPMKAQVPETQQQLKDQRRVIFQERQRKPLNQEAGLRSKAFNNKKSFGLEQFLGAFWQQRNSEKRAGSWDCVARQYISFFFFFMSLLQYFSPHLTCTLLSVYRIIVNLQCCVSFKCIAKWFKHTIYIYIYMFVAQSCPTLWDPIKCNPSGPSVHGLL